MRGWLVVSRFPSPSFWFHLAPQFWIFCSSLSVPILMFILVCNLQWNKCSLPSSLNSSQGVLAGLVSFWPHRGYSTIASPYVYRLPAYHSLSFSNNWVGFCSTSHGTFKEKWLRCILLFLLFCGIAGLMGYSGAGTGMIMSVGQLDLCYSEAVSFKLFDNRVVVS